MLAVSIWIVAVLCAGVIASNKNRSAIGWCLITVFFPIAILILLCLQQVPYRTTTVGES